MAVRTRKAIDVSNYSGIPNAATLALLKAQGVKHAIVRLSLEDERRRQISILQLKTFKAAGFTCSGYVWAPPGDADPYDTGDRAMSIAVEAQVPLTMVWADFEEGTVQGAAIGPWLFRFHEGIGFDQKLGIYTRRNWWEAHGDPNILLGEYECWLAHYDGNASLDTEAPFACFKRIAGKQYENTHAVGNISVDSNVFRSKFAS